jgi:hypothetical protein
MRHSMSSVGAALLSELKFEPFYFTSYDRVIGIAGNVRELDLEMKRLSRGDRACLEYHLASGNIVRWLEYADEAELAMDLRGIVNADEAILIVEKYVARAVMFHRMRRGRMR